MISTGNSSEKSSNLKRKQSQEETTPTTTPSNKKKKSRPKHQKTSAVVKIPTSQKEASTNWKLLLSKKSADIAAKKEERKKNDPSKPQFLRRDVKRHKKQLMDKKMGVGDSSLDATIKSTEELKITTINPSSSTSSAKSHGKKVAIPLLEGVNSLGFFDYTHYGHLKTVVGPEHEFLTKPTPTIAIDCEMVGVGPLKEDALARVSIVNEFGYCLYDKFVKPKVEVTDYRTEFSGVREEDLKKAEDFGKVLQEVADLLKGRTLVGHSLKSDFDVLLLKQPKAKIRDTAFYYRKRYKKLRTPSLKGLVKDFIKVDIQKGEHNSITDAQAAMRLYLFAREEWEASYSEKYNFRNRRYWHGAEYRNAFKAVGITVVINKKKEGK